MGVTQGVKRTLQQNRHGSATIFGERTRSWAEFVERVARLAGGLGGLGVGSGDRVAILSLNSDRYLEFYVAVPWRAAWSSPPTYAGRRPRTSIR
jgi:long-chain acyl-CoA synthetase